MSDVTSTSTLLYLHADRFVEAAGTMGLRAEAPRTGSNVKTKELADLLWSSAIAQLVRDGKIAVAEVEKKVVFVKTKRLVLTPVDGVATGDAMPPSLEQDVLSLVQSRRGDKDGLDVKTMVRSPFQKDVNDPWAGTVEIVQEYAIAAGLGAVETEKRAGALGAVGLKKRVVTWDRPAIETLASHATAAHEAFISWSGSNLLAAAIRKDVRDAITSREERSRD